MNYPKTIVIDFDGTIMPNVYPLYVKPYSNVVSAIHAMRRAGYKILIHTCRTASYWYMMGSENIPSLDKALEELIEYLVKYEIPYDGIWTGDKPDAMYYIDDRGIRFEGNWQKTINKIRGCENVKL